MPQIFHPSFNLLARLSIFGGVLVPVIALVTIDRINRSQVVTGVEMAIEQPVQFSHQHHVGGLGVDCRYCHTSVEESASAGIPSVDTCAGCHKEIWSDAPLIKPVLEAYRTGKPMRWRRVHDLPDFAYFNHSIHIKKGVGCASCHGRVDRMPLVWRASSLQMDWCLECHRNPGPNLRPQEHIYDMAWTPPGGQAGRELQERLMKQYRIRSERELTTCSVCHR